MVAMNAFRLAPAVARERGLVTATLTKRAVRHQQKMAVALRAALVVPRVIAAVYLMRRVALVAVVKKIMNAQQNLEDAS